MIPVMDVKRQYESLAAELDQAALQTLHAGQYILGQDEKEFEKEFAAYCGVKYAVGVGNGTDALTIALRAAGIGAGDEVITCAMSFFATAEAIACVGATPIFVDCTSDTYVMDADAIEDKITEKTKAILPIHLYGQCADMGKITEIANRYGLYVIEDCAQAAGAEYHGRRAGSFGDMGCVSFFPTKNLGCAGDGGMILTNDEELYKLCQAYRVHGSGANGLLAYGKQNGLPVDEKKIDFHGNLPKYYNFVLGYNSRLDTLQAALLRVKLPHLDDWNKKRREIAEIYDNGIGTDKVKKPVCAAGNHHIYYIYVLLVEDRESFRHYMEENGIGTGVYFPVALHLQKVFEGLGYQLGDMPNAEYLAEHGVAIPMFPELKIAEIEQVVNVINQY